MAAIFEYVIKDISRGENAKLDEFIAEPSSNELLSECGIRLLTTAVKYGNEDAIRKLVKAGVPINGVDEFGNAAIHYVGKCQSIKVLECLISLGADIDAKGAGMAAPLRTISHDGWLPGVRYLVAHGADLDIEDASGITPLMAAAYSSKASAPNIIKHLIASGCDTDKATSSGMDALKYAINYDHYISVDMLLKHDLTMCLHQNHPASILHYAIRAGAPKVVSLLLHLGYDIQELNEHGSTPLHAACKPGATVMSAAVIEELVLAGADRDALDSDGIKPIEYLSNNGADFEYLLAYQQAERKLIAAQVDDSFKDDASREHKVRRI